MIFDRKHGKHIQELNKALRDYICAKLPKECKVLREEVNTLKQWENVDADTKPKPDLNSYFKLLKDLRNHVQRRPSAARGANLLWKVIDDIRNYSCEVGNSAECKALSDVLEEKELEKVKTGNDQEKNDLIADADENFKGIYSS